MTSEERSNWITGFVTLGAYLTYVSIVLQRSHNVELVEVAYVSPLLWTIGLSIAATIAGSIVAAIITAIVSPQDVDRKDERDRAINRRGEFVGYYVLSVGVIGALVLTMMEFNHFWIANTIYLAFVFSSLVSTVVKIVVYRRGF